MSNKSDGKKAAVKKKSSQIAEKKIRSHSVGSISHSLEEINDSIDQAEVKTDKKSYDKEYSSRDLYTRMNQNLNIPGGLENNGTENNYDDVFAPKTSIGRTPPSGKRPWSETSPATSPSEEQDRLKILRQIEKIEDTPKNEVHKCKETNNEFDRNGKTDTLIKILLEELGKINTITNKEDFDKNDRPELRKASFNLHKTVTALVYKMGQMEMKNLMPEKQIERKPEGSVCEIIQKGIQNVPKTYSSIVGTKNYMSESDKGEKKWITPPKHRTNEMLIKPKNPEKTVSVLKEIKKNLTGTNETFKSIRNLKNGSLIVQCNDEKQRQRIHTALRQQNTLEIKDFRNDNPMIMITGIDSGYEYENFITEFINDNPDIKTSFGENVKEKITFVAKKKCRNNNKENWILQTPPDIFKWLIRRENLVFDLTRAYVQEYINLAMCYKCCYFGHVAKYCKSDLCCFKCGRNHDSNKCSTEKLDCPNCKRIGLQERMHTAKDRSCPAYLKKIDRQREYTNFSASENQERHFL